MGTGNMYKNLVKFRRVVFEICERTDKQTNKRTYRHADRNTLGELGLIKCHYNMKTLSLQRFTVTEVGLVHAH